MDYDTNLKKLVYFEDQYGVNVNLSGHLNYLNHFTDNENAVKVNENVRLKTLQYNTNAYKIETISDGKLSNLNYVTDLNKDVKTTGSLDIVANEYTKVDTGTSSIGFGPYSSASKVTFNNDSPINYVNQINIVYYMVGNNVTQSIIDFTQDLSFQIIGNSNPGLYETNFDYNTPYRASFITKNWPVYQYDTGSNWRIPVILNCSNSELKISATSAEWVEADLEGGGTLTDQYGFSIDL